MKKALIIIALFFSTLTQGQIPKEEAYKNIIDLAVIDLVSQNEIIGGFHKGNGFWGYNFRLDSNMTFQKIDYSCMVRLLVDSGSWSIKNHNTIVLKSNIQTLYFDVLKFDNFYFFIQHTQRRKFVADLKEAKIKFKDFKPITIDDKIISEKTMIGMTLGEIYYSKEIIDITGT